MSSAPDIGRKKEDRERIETERCEKGAGGEKLEFECPKLFSLYFIIIIVINFPFYKKHHPLKEKLQNGPCDQIQQ